MIRRFAALASAFALTVGSTGCDRPAPGTASPTTRSTVPDTPATRPGRDVEVRTPGADVDVRRDADGRLKVDVRAKDRSTAR
jgi:hypothetical protein